jgi:glycine betaine/proline transport system permease protein
MVILSSVQADILPPRHAPFVPKVSAVTLSWLITVAFVLVCISMRGSQPWLASFPTALQLPVAASLNAAMDMFVAHTEAFFRLVARGLDYPMSWVRNVLHWLPWSVVVCIFMAVAWRAAGWRLTAFTGLAFLYVLMVGLWPQTMNSLALVLISVPLAVLLGFGLGVLGFLSRRAERALLPLTNIAQTVPAFAYLLPILILFGFGPVVGLIASILFAFPPMVRNTIVGLRGVPPEIVEAGRMSGATPWQLFWMVRYPAALRQLLLGVNQTTMASLGMVIIASIIGGTSDIGWEVLSTMRRADFGGSLVAGIVIALLAMILDRITAGLAERRRDDTRVSCWHRRHAWALCTAGATLLLFALAQMQPALAVWPAGGTLPLADPLNEAIRWFVLSFKPMLDAIKNGILFFAMLPVKIGFEQTVSPFTWGFALAGWHVALYAFAAAGAAFCAWRAGHEASAAAILVIAAILYVGLTSMPWPAMFVTMVFFGYRLGGTRLAAGTALTIAFLLVTGNWHKAMISLYLCTIAVGMAFVGGTIMGILASENDTFSRIMRPINDTMQTMPQFVLLIPVVMIFSIGEFTAVLAIILYAYVPAFRYAENGFRRVDQSVLEAATSMGTTSWQRLAFVKLPLARANILLGLNQSLMYGIGMLVITALVGTSDLGQEIYIGLSAGNFGQGFVAGLGMAAIAVLCDAYCRAWLRGHHQHRTDGPLP